VTSAEVAINCLDDYGRKGNPCIYTQQPMFVVTGHVKVVKGRFFVEVLDVGSIYPQKKCE